MYHPAIEYDYPLFRPPSEGNSLILQITTGCSWNKCAFCEMYAEKQFKTKNFEQIKKEIESFKPVADKITKIFLADGDALVLKTEKLLRVLNEINKIFPRVRRVSSYAKPKDLKNKSISDLKRLKEAGLSLVYVGLESGDSELLTDINKGEDFESSRQGMVNCKEAGIKSSVMILNGLGGLNYWEQHALNSAKLINEIQPEFLSTLVLSFPFGVAHYKKKFQTDFIEMNTVQLLEELFLFLNNTNLQTTVFRSDHASNYLTLKGILSKDKEQLLKKLRLAIQNPEQAGLRAEWQRGL
ncbi:MAG: radical SAM protein [Bacteroidetes bacterium]|nr:MAG: radical SAM protein [Bacteroidota bacterium]